ncbi:MAG TPA: DPP IV N-terminal domain-containing protein, partial [Pyrinomonadaceae bacterium]
MTRLKAWLLVTFVLALISPSLNAQNKLLTIDDIFDPVKRVNFNGTTPNIRWLKDGQHYLLTNEAGRRDVPRIQKVDAATGEAVPFFDAAKMQAAFAALPGITTENARQLANRGNYDLNPAETGVLLNWSNDLFYYEFGSDRAIRLTSTPEEEVGEEFSPDGRMVSFVRGNNLYVEDLGMQRRERALTRDGSAKILNGRLDWVYQEELYGRGNFGAYWWSPDSTTIVFLRIDESPV